MDTNYGLANYLGSIDLDKRKVLHHPDGSIGTEYSFGFSPDGTTEVLIPQIVDGVNLFKPAAVNHFYKTGEHLGTWDKPTEMKSKGLSEQEFYKMLSDYANSVHERQAKHYKGKK